MTDTQLPDGNFYQPSPEDWRSRMEPDDVFDRPLQWELISRDEAIM
jgi:hypothetical protein